ncbi:MAG TPA: sucrase ferredoxin [Acidimicrobiales bacterium]|nr:sucrase ferredoxin [Acidimicrobiales bacterium]
MTSAEPDDELTLRCAPWTQAQGVDPIGSATRFDVLVLVEHPLPWPDDVSELPLLAGRSAPGVRIMAVAPEDRAGRRAGHRTVVHWRRTGTNRFVGTDHLVPERDLPALLDDLLAEPDADHRDRPSAVGLAPPEVLVCAHGRRDPCCGRWGTLLHLELADRWSDVRTWRCSHTGGHRFAPTAITLPDGRAWAYAEPELLDQVVHRRGPLPPLAEHDRGTSALSPFAQVVERAVFHAVGWRWLDETVTAVEEVVDDDGQAATVTLRWPGGSATGRVIVDRLVPVLVCGEPPEAATKSSPDLALVDLVLHA